MLQYTSRNEVLSMSSVVTDTTEREDVNWTTFNVTMTTQSDSGDNDVPRPAAPTLQDIMNQYWQYRVSQAMGIYFFPVIIALGTLGNFLSFFVLIRKSMRTSSTCVYMCILAITDTLVLYFSGFRKWFSFLNGYDAMIINPAACTTFNFFSYFAFDYSVWLLVAMTIERFIAIHFPLKASQMATPSRAKKVAILILVIFVLFNCHFFWTVTIDDRGQCTPQEGFEKFHDDIFPWIDATVYSFLPFSILITFNVLIIRDNRIATGRRATLRGRTTNATNSGSQARIQFHQRLTVMLLSISFCFLVCSSPKVILISIRETAFSFFDERGIPQFEVFANYTLASRISDTFIYTNHSINFLLYSITGQRFRKELKKFICCGRNRIQRRNTISLSLDGLESRRTSETAAQSSGTNGTVFKKLSTEVQGNDNTSFNANENCKTSIQTQNHI